MVKTFNFGERSAVKINQSLFISLPAIWLKNNSVKRKDLLTIVMNEDGDLVIKKNGRTNEIK